MQTVKVEVGQKRGSGDDSRRFTPTAFSFDTRANLLSTVIEDDWEDSIKEQWQANQQAVREILIHTFGAHIHAEKIQNFTDLGAAPWSVVALHNTYLSEVRAAFTATCYYPALLGACGLGERILNQLVLRLRGDYPDHEATKYIATQQSIDKWDKCIRALTGWGVFDQEVATEYRQLMQQRHAAVHYRSDLDSGNAREAALAAVMRISDIVNRVFSPMESSSHYFTGPIGRSYVKREDESLPFVKHFIIPACVLVSPTYRFVANSAAPGGFDVFDDADYGVGHPPLSDEQFADPGRATPQVTHPF
ncbi:hypothetical protein [Nocardioides gilvus]|uniref:hypothetical protein n=1 Tax=Nocardioides gilvus TaxID=1735589 RepID=UPI000D74DD99|nr:hypothetical protein [Nocardioides gilvus]